MQSDNKSSIKLLDKNYKTIARETLDKAYNEIKDKFASGAIDQDVIKDKIKDKLKNKFKKLLK